MNEQQEESQKQSTVSTLTTASAPPDKSSKCMHTRLHMCVRVLLLLLFMLGFTLTVLPQGRATLRSTMLLPALISASESAPLTTSGEPIEHRQMTIPSTNGTVYLDVYEPTTKAPLVSSVRSGVLIIPGAGDNRKVPQLINLSEALARTGIVTVDMLTPTLINYDLSAQDSDAVVQAFQTLEHLPGMDGKRAGMISFSAGVPLACFGSADPRIRDHVAYIAVFGGYFRTVNVLRAFGRRAITIDGKTESWQPTAVPILVLTNLITRDLPPAERSRIQQATAPGGTPLTALEIKQLTLPAQAAYALLTGDAPAKVEANFAALPAPTRAQLEILSPSRIINQVRAPIFLLHDRNDTSIPSTESRDFAAALTRLHHPHDYVEFHIFDHVQMRSDLNIGQIATDGSRLFTILNELLTQAS